MESSGNTKGMLRCPRLFTPVSLGQDIKIGRVYGPKGVERLEGR